MNENNNNARDLYRQNDLPVFQNRMYNTAFEARNCPMGQVRLVEDLKTGLVRNAAFDATMMDYDNFYQNEQGNSTYFKAHLEEVASLVLSEMGSDGLVEVGCGKGTFLDILLKQGADITGFDPAYEGQSNRIERVYFSESLGIRGKGIILRHVLEHIERPISFLERLAKANGHQGLIYIEVPCFDWICENRAWYDVFYEHVNYFRLSDFHRIFDSVLHADRAFGGQYLRVIADLSQLAEPLYDRSNSIDFPDDFTKQLDQLSEKHEKAPLVVWGGASKGVIYSLISERSGRKVLRLIDINPAKQGLFVPGTGLKVMSPKEGLADLPAGTTIMVMNPNYLDEVRAMSGPNFNFKTLSEDD